MKGSPILQPGQQGHTDPVYRDKKNDRNGKKNKFILHVPHPGVPQKDLDQKNVYISIDRIIVKVKKPIDRVGGRFFDLDRPNKYTSIHSMIPLS